MMDLGIQIAVALLCVPLLVLGVRSMFKPSTMLVDLAVEPLGSAGLNTIRGVLGGLFLSSVVMLVLGLLQHETLWFLAVAISMGTAAVGRVVGVVLDGFDRAIIRPLVVELVMVVVLLLAHFRLASTP